MTDWSYMSERGLDKLSEKEKEVLYKWIRQNLKPIKTQNLDYPAYSIKHLFQKEDIGFYITNRQMIEALEICGFETKIGDETNRCFNVSKKSIKEIKKRINKFRR